MTRPRLLRDDRGASSAEFAFVLPLLLFLLFGIIDAGRYMWAINQAEKAAQMGVRMAVVTNGISSSLNDDYVGQCSTPLTAGDPIPADCFTQITCSKAGASASCNSGAADSTAFNAVADRIRTFLPQVEDSNIQIIYSPSGLGYAGNPSGPDVSPLVTVRLSGITFVPTTTLALGSMALPEVRSSLTAEDASGQLSN